MFIGTGVDRFISVRYYINSNEAIEINYGTGEFENEVDSIYKKNFKTGETEYIGNEVEWVGDDIDNTFKVLYDGEYYDIDDRTDDSDDSIN